MKISVIGTGYVGLVTGTCLAEIGNQVICVDVDKEKIQKLNKGISPIYEEHLEDLIENNLKNKRLKFTASLEEAVNKSEIIFIAVGTPSKSNGQIDMGQVDEAARGIGKYINEYKIIVNKSTVPVGTTKRVRNIIYLNMKDKSIEFDVVSNPEFLREGTAVFDTFNGDRIVIGSDSSRAIKALKKLYAPLNNEILVTNPESSEMIKYASNAFLATKISFINEIANICEKVGADVKEVAEGMGMDKRIGDKFLRAGIGFGGACFPKDIKALIQIGDEAGYKPQIIKKVLEVNDIQKTKAVDMLKVLFSNLSNIKVGILGLAFKPGTDDLREAPSLNIINELLRLGAKVKVFDPVALKNARKVLKQSVTYCNDAYEVTSDTDVILIITEWPEFKRLDYNRIKGLMANNIIIDGRNLLNYKEIKKLGFKYYGIGISEASIEKHSNKSRVIKINKKQHIHSTVTANTMI